MHLGLALTVPVLELEAKLAVRLELLQREICLEHVAYKKISNNIPFFSKMSRLGVVPC